MMSIHLVGLNNLSMHKFIEVFGLLMVMLDVHLQNQYEYQYKVNINVRMQ